MVNTEYYGENNNTFVYIVIIVINIVLDQIIWIMVYIWYPKYYH